MRISLIVVLAVCLLLLLSQVAGQESGAVEATPSTMEEVPTFDFWMNVKLQESQKLFAALAQADFKSISDSGEHLKTVSSLEGFVRRKTPGYLTQLKAFEFSVDEILRQSEKQSIEGVTLGFQQLTLSCVNCHKQMR